MLWTANPWIPTLSAAVLCAAALCAAAVLAVTVCDSEMQSLPRRLQEVGVGRQGGTGFCRWLLHCGCSRELALLG